MLRFFMRNGALARRKFARYRLWFAICFALFCLAWILEMILFRAGIRVTLPGGGSFLQAFSAIATREGILYLVTLLTGVTIYAPATAIIASLLRGFTAGFVLSSLLPLTGGRAVVAFLLTALYLIVSTIWYLAYADFCVCASQKIFSSHLEKGAAGEERLFGGALFYTEFFCGSVNPRFLSSYVLFFFASLLGQALLTAGYALARVRLL